MACLLFLNVCVAEHEIDVGGFVHPRHVGVVAVAKRWDGLHGMFLFVGFGSESGCLFLTFFSALVLFRVGLDATPFLSSSEWVGGWSVIRMQADGLRMEFRGKVNWVLGCWG